VTGTAIIALGATVIGVIGVVLLDHLAHGAVHTILTALLLVVLIAAALLLHHSADRIEWDMKHSIRRGGDQGT
jgi:hypothetical protein